MDKSISDTLRRLAWPTYLVAFLLVAITKMDYLTNVWPLRFGEVQWRYGSMGLLAGFLLTPLLGILFAMVASAILEHRLVLRILAIINVVSVAFLVLIIPFFVLDALQLRGTVNPEALTVFDVGVVKAAVKHLSIAVALGWLGWAGLSASKGHGKKRRQPSPLVARQAQEGEG
jgi:hypothetical protein